MPALWDDISCWDEATQGVDFSEVDRVSNGLFNNVLWKGLTGDKPYPVIHAAYNTPSGEADESSDDDDADESK